ncbi:hypothetical protein RFF73_11240, partial [Streptococcus ruminantium]|nr:hypothetical protein [Streptococcus ruminantium]
IKTVILENTEKLPNIEVDLDKSTDLNQANFTVTGARLTDVKKISDTKYQLKLDNPKILVGGTIGVTIHKYGYQVENSNQKIT